MAKGEMEPLTKPYNEMDVDMELWNLLDLAHDDELHVLHDILHGAHLRCRECIPRDPAQAP